MLGARQAAVAAPDEGGTMVVHSATQSLDTVQHAVAKTLGLQDSKVRPGSGHDVCHVEHLPEVGTKDMARTCKNETALDFWP